MRTRKKKVIVFDFGGVIVNSTRNAEYSKNKLKLGVFSGMPELLKVLASKTLIALNTAAYNRNCLPMLERHGLINLFSSIATRDTGETKEENFLYIAKSLKVEIQDLIFVTDTVGDLINAEKLEIKTIGILWGLHDRAHFETREFSNLMSLTENVSELQKLLISELQ